MRRWILGLVVFSLSCANEDHVPRDVIQEEEMNKILWDVVQADQYVNQYLKKDSLQDKRKEEAMAYYDQIFRIHHVTRDQFDKSLRFYLDHPTIGKVLFDSLAIKANRRRNEIYERPFKQLEAK